MKTPTSSIILLASIEQRSIPSITHSIPWLILPPPQLSVLLLSLSY